METPIEQAELRIVHRPAGEICGPVVVLQDARGKDIAYLARHLERPSGEAGPEAKEYAQVIHWAQLFAAAPKMWKVCTGLAAWAHMQDRDFDSTTELGKLVAEAEAALPRAKKG